MSFSSVPFNECCITNTAPTKCILFANIYLANLSNLRIIIYTYLNNQAAICKYKNVKFNIWSAITICEI